jgi:hypothetical protein
MALGTMPGPFSNHRGKATRHMESKYERCIGSQVEEVNSLLLIVEAEPDTLDRHHDDITSWTA